VLSATALKNFKRYRRLRLQFVSAVGDGVKKFLALSATAVKYFKRCRRQQLQKLFLKP
jgi:hypothetical protein